MDTKLCFCFKHISCALESIVLYFTNNLNKPDYYYYYYIRILNPVCGGGQMAHRRKLAVWAMFLYSKQQKSYQGTLGTLELTPIGSRASLGPSMDPTGPLSWTLFSSIFQLRFAVGQLPPPPNLPNLT